MAMAKSRRRVKIASVGVSSGYSLTKQQVEAHEEFFSLIVPQVRSLSIYKLNEKDDLESSSNYKISL